MDHLARPDVRELLEAFRARRAAVDEEFGGFDSGRMHWTPGPGRWSVGECLHHLCRTGFAWADHLGPVLFAALRRGARHDAPHRPGPLGRRVIRAMEPGARPARAPGPFRPLDSAQLAPEDLLRAFTALGHSWEATLLRASRLDLSRLRVGSPAAPLLVLPLGTWLYALSAHEDRHLEQARRVTAAPGFGG